MNEAKIEELGAKPLQDLISNVRPSAHSSFTFVEQIVCIPLFVCLNTDSDWGMGSD